MKLQFVIIMFLAMVAIQSCGSTYAVDNCVENRKQTTITKKYKVKEGSTLVIDVKTSSGIKVIGGSGNTVEIKITYNPEVVEYDFERDDEQIIIRGNTTVEDDKYYSYRVGNTIIRDKKYRNDNSIIYVKVPHRFNVDANTTGGAIHVNNVDGRIKGKTMGGALELKNLKGYLKMSTMGGAITLSNSDVDGRVSTMGGSVLLRNVVGDVDASTMGGEIKQINVRSRKGNLKRDSEIKMSTMGGDIHLDEALSGADVSTMGGDIYVNKACRFVKASTMGGDIVLKDVEGKISASTKGGNITITLSDDANDARGDIYISNLAGDIELYVPDDFSMKAKLEITSSADDIDDVIISDFPIDKNSRYYNDSRSNKYNIRKIKAKIKNGNGKHSVRIRTTDGTVTIKRK